MLPRMTADRSEPLAHQPGMLCAVAQIVNGAAMQLDTQAERQMLHAFAEVAFHASQSSSPLNIMMCHHELSVSKICW